MNIKLELEKLPLSIHIKDDGLIAGGIDNRPEGVLVNLSNLPNQGFRLSKHGLQARTNLSSSHLQSLPYSLSDYLSNYAAIALGIIAPKFDPSWSDGATS